jgi:transcriptional regulator with XRE-family HTH domain
MTQRAPHIHPLTAARASQRISQRSLGKLAGVSQVAISHIETGQTANPHRLTRRALADALAFNEADLFPDDGNRSPSAEIREWQRALLQQAGR